MDRSLINDFWACGDDSIIQFAITRAHLNKRERDVLILTLDECMTQEQIAEHIHYSVRQIQNYWYSATNKLLAIPWVEAYAKELRNTLRS